MRIATYTALLLIYAILSPCAYTAVKNIQDEADFTEAVLKKPGIKMVVFSTGWCGYCKKLDPLIRKISDGYSDKLAFYVVDGDKLYATAKKYKVNGYPTAVFIEDGIEKGRMIGYHEEQQIIDIINKQLK